MRTFETGATRDSDETKHDYEGFLSPTVLQRFAEYMTKNRVQADGKLRASDNWQKGIPRDAYMKSMFRHFMDLWLAHRQGQVNEEALCALLFNVQGYLHEGLKARSASSITNTKILLSTANAAVPPRPECDLGRDRDGACPGCLWDLQYGLQSHQWDAR